jgi:hypothetical protein
VQGFLIQVETIEPMRSGTSPDPGRGPIVTIASLDTS